MEDEEKKFASLKCARHPVRLKAVALDDIIVYTKTRETHVLTTTVTDKAIVPAPCSFITFNRHDILKYHPEEFSLIVPHFIH